MDEQREAPRWLERPYPTQRLIIDVCGGNPDPNTGKRYQNLVSSLHHGLEETSLCEFYPHLNFVEAAAFAVKSWNLREYEPETFSTFVRSNDIYHIFADIFEEAFPWLNKHRDLSNDRVRSQYERLNPFGRTLEARLNRVSPEAVQTLIQGLLKPTKYYTFESKHSAAHRKTKKELQLMRFQSYYPNAETNVPNFASEVARIFKRYPREYMEFVQVQPDEPPEPPKPPKQKSKKEPPKNRQLELF